jgi:hypothetical protein
MPEVKAILCDSELRLRVEDHEIGIVAGRDAPFATAETGQHSGSITHPTHNIG